MKEKSNPRVNFETSFLVPASPQDIQAVGRDLKRFWYDAKKGTVRIAFDFEPSFSYSAYCSRLRHLHQLFQQLRTYDLFNAQSWVEFTSLDMEDIYDNEADFNLFGVHPKSINTRLTKAYHSIEYRPDLYFDDLKTPAIVCYIKNRDMLELANNEERMGGSYILGDYESVCIPIASIITMEVYKF